ncbi:DUF1826 domain-containing protein [Marinobacter bohaiensis]|uniref:DUF1826 domain-containing protein n=1 Tax=Marinobacter bohaiensis TaxID=2201898 RepID=UPI000DAD1B41|nr:DUF1826 domain-containing protein [Marinobacter bohaiensis]
MTHFPETISQPLAVESTQAECLTEIFRDDVNLTVWKRPPLPGAQTFAQSLFAHTNKLERFINLGPGEPANALLPDWARQLDGAAAWLDDVNQLIDMYRCLFEPDAVGVRLHALNGTMCPRFHTDRVPVRLLCTYRGTGTEWLPESAVARGVGADPLPNQTPGEGEIQQVPPGAVALLKGEAWIGNEGRGLVHRSPDASRLPRLVLGLDWLAD